MYTFDISSLLHITLQSFPNYSTICSIIRVEPNYLQIQDSKGNLPLHIAIVNGVGDDIILELLRGYPDAVKVKNKDGYTALSCALFASFSLTSTASCSTQVIMKIIDIYPDACKECYEEDFYLLHLCAKYQCDPEILQHIISKCQNSPRLMSNSSLPLHIACSTAPKYLSLVKICILLRAYPDGTKIPDGQGTYPLHLLSKHLIPTEFYTNMIQHYPEACQIVNKELNSPLHILCEYYPTVGNIKALLSKYPDAAKLKNDQELLPIQIFLLHQAIKLSLFEQMDIVRILLRVYPESAFEKLLVTSSLSNTLALAISNGYEYMIIRMLVNSHPIKLSDELLNYREMNWDARKHALGTFVRIKMMIWDKTSNPIIELVNKLCTNYDNNNDDKSDEICKIENPYLIRISYYL